MTLISAYWEAVAIDIAKLSNHHHPNNWNKPDIDAFIGKLISKVKAACKRDFQKASLLLSLKKRKASGGYNYDAISLSYDTFRNIFIVKKSFGKVFTRHLFAIYLGYNSFEDYVAQKDIKGLTEEKVIYDHPKPIMPNALADQPTLKEKELSLNKFIVNRIFWLILAFMLLHSVERILVDKRLQSHAVEYYEEEEDRLRYGRVRQE